MANSEKSTKTPVTEQPVLNIVVINIDPIPLKAKYKILLGGHEEDLGNRLWVAYKEEASCNRFFSSSAATVIGLIASHYWQQNSLSKRPLLDLDPQTLGQKILTDNKNLIKSGGKRRLRYGVKVLANKPIEICVSKIRISTGHGIYTHYASENPIGETSVGDTEAEVIGAMAKKVAKEIGWPWWWPKKYIKSSAIELGDAILNDQEYGGRKFWIKVTLSSISRPTKPVIRKF